MSWLLIIVGALLLVVGAEALVRGASGLALLAKLSPTVVGLTIVAAGTSMPELVVSVQAAWQGMSGMAIGNVVGSNIFNTALILGVAAMIRPLTIPSTTFRTDWPMMMLCSVVLYVLILDREIGQAESAVMVIMFIAFVGYMVRVGRQDAKEEDAEALTTASFGTTGAKAAALNVGAVAVGTALLAAGASALVEGAVDIALDLGLSQTVVGLTIVAAGTSTPELVTSVVAGLRGQDGMAVANVIGSNIFNIIAILGITGLILPLSVPDEIITRDIWWMLGVSAALLPIMYFGRQIGRGRGVLLTVTFIAYTAVLIAQAG